MSNFIGNHHKLRREVVRLERVIGLNTQASCSLSLTAGNHLLYAAGAVVIRYDSSTNQQKAFYRATKPISCLAVSADGQYLAAGERGHMPSIHIWNLATSELLCTLTGHTQGVSCLAFSPDAKYLVSIGFKFDKQLFLWDWAQKLILSTQKVGNKVKVVKFSKDGSFFITCGQHHMKWWYMKLSDHGGAMEVFGKPASILEAQRDAHFMDFCFGSSPDSADKVFCTTSTGVLCSFTASRIMERWVQLEASSSFCLDSITLRNHFHLVAGCSDGLIRVFSSNLEYIATLPLPDPISTQSAAAFPACYALVVIPEDSRLAAVYADRQLIVWDFAADDFEHSTRFRYFRNHYSCIWELCFIKSPAPEDSADASTAASAMHLTSSSFVTCAADNSVKVWSLETKHSKAKASTVNGLLHSIDLEDDSDFASQLNLTGTMVEDALEAVCDLSRGVPDTELPDRTQTNTSLRCLAVHPDGSQIVCGDRKGRIRCFDLKTLSQTRLLEAHSSEVLTLSYSPQLRQTPDGEWLIDADGESDKSLVLLASAGRDRLVHVFNASSEYSPITTLDNHTSSVTSVKFTSDGKRLLSCGGDKTIVFNAVNGPEIARLKTVPTPHGTINGLAIDPINKFAATSGQDKRLNIWNIQTGKHVRAYKHQSIAGELYRADIDPSGMYVATCAFDKVIRIFDFFSGDLIAQVSGHGEMITGVRFSPDGKFLLSTGGDGCIFVWKLGSSLVAAMRDRLVELYSNAQRKSQLVSQSQPESVPIPPVVEPVEARKDAIETVTPRKSVLAQINNMRPPSTPAPVPDVPDRVRSSPQSALRIDGGVTTSPSRASVEEDLVAYAEPKVSSVAESSENPWAAKVAGQGGYELFGQKILGGDFQSKRERNKFTALLTTEVSADTRLVMADDGEVIRVTESIEASDDVMRLSDDDEAMFKDDGRDTEEEYLDVPDNDKDRDLERAASKLDHLEESMGNLENWLEEKLREEGVMLSNEANSANLLSSSLSSKFFSNLREAKAEAKVTDALELPPPPPAVNVIESKRRQTNAAVALMQEQLKAMGILDKTSIRLKRYATQAKPGEDTPGGAEDSVTESDDTDKDPDDVKPQEALVSAMSEVHETKDDEDHSPLEQYHTNLVLKTDDAKDALRTFTSAMTLARAKFEELSRLRNQAPSSKSELRSSPRMDEAITEADSLMQEFRQSLMASLDNANSTFRDRQDVRLSALSLSSSRIMGLNDSMEVSAVLEKYSDRLLEIVSEKIATKMAAKSNESS